jgi:hypothetical protein
MTCLSKAALLEAAAAPLPRERIDLPELGGYVWVQGMSGTDRDHWEKSLVVGRGKRRDVNTENVRAKLAVRCLVDEAGVRLFDDGDVHPLGRLRVDVLNRIFEAAQRLSGVSDEDIDELKKFSAPEAGTASSSS